MPCASWFQPEPACSQSIAALPGLPFWPHAFPASSQAAFAHSGVVLCASAAQLRRRPGLSGAIVRALVAGYRFTLAHPARSGADLLRQVPGLDPSLVAAELTGLLPAFRGPAGHVGELNEATLRRWAVLEARFGIVTRPPDVATTFDPRFLSGAGAG